MVLAENALFQHELDRFCHIQLKNKQQASCSFEFAKCLHVGKVNGNEEIRKPQKTRHKKMIDDQIAK